MPGNRYASIQNPRMYRALRRAGYSKEAAARISNAQTPGATVERKAAAGALAIPPHGSAALFNTPGAGPRRRRKAFDESKVDRDDTGKFSSDGGSGGASKPEKPKPDKGKKPPKQTPEQRAAEREAKRQENIDKSFAASGLGEDSFYSLMDFAGGKVDAPDGEKELLDAGLIEQGRDGKYRLTSAGRALSNAAERGDTRGVKDTISKARDQKAERAERQAAREQKRAEREAKRAERERARAERQAAKKPKPAGEAAPPKKGGGGGGGKPSRPTVVGGRDLFGVAGQGTLTKAMRPARRKVWRTAYAQAKAGGFAAPAARAQARLALRRDAADRAARNYERAVGSLAVFKDAQGRARWLTITTTAYRDQDKEYISRKGIRGAVALGDHTGERGTLRFWHVPGLDFGPCDYQATAQDDRMLIESGTFYSPRHAAVVKEAARRGWQISPGFTHPATEPDPAGVFDHIAIFERSITPPRRASNLFTALATVQGAPMLTQEKRKELEALAGDPAAVAEFLAMMQRTDKEAQQIATYKSSDAPAVYTLPDGTPGVIVDGVFQTLKAATEKAPMPPAQMMQAAMTEAADAGAELAAEGAEAVEEVAAVSDDTDVMDLTVGDLKAVLGGLVEDMIAGYNAKMGEMKAQYEAMGKAFGQLQAQKDDSAAQAQTVVAEVATLKATLAATEARLKELEGDAAPAARRAQGGEPAAVAPVDPAALAQLAALKSTNDPVAAATAWLFPE